jgi:hypothetical protein
MTPQPRSATLVGANRARSEIVMEHADEFILTALTLILARQILAEALASGREITSDPVDQATHLIQQQRIPITGRFGLRHF